LARLEGQDVDIDQIASDVKRSAELVKYCKEKLKNTENEVDAILKDMKE
jgi:exodeoxyribonuclease VII small subunit